MRMFGQIVGISVCISIFTDVNRLSSSRWIRYKRSSIPRQIHQIVFFSRYSQLNQNKTMKFLVFTTLVAVAAVATALPAEIADDPTSSVGNILDPTQLTSCVRSLNPSVVSELSGAIQKLLTTFNGEIHTNQITSVF